VRRFSHISRGNSGYASTTSESDATKMNEANIVPLSHLEPEETAIIRVVEGEGAFRRRLLDIGFRTGAVVTMVKQAPLADPIEYLLDGSHVSLRGEEASQILVQRLARPRRRFGPRWRGGRGRFRFGWRRRRP
jgi:ferrous iron transport protein A